MYLSIYYIAPYFSPDEPRQPPVAGPEDRPRPAREARDWRPLPDESSASKPAAAELERAQRRRPEFRQKDTPARAKGASMYVL